MDELELLKKDWQKEDNKNFPVLSYKEIYKMILKKSSSIVKWIFIISLLELVFWLALSFIFKATSKNNQITDLESTTVFIVLSVISYAVLVYFFYRFYMNYKTINSTDNASTLMKNILKTRRTVKQYVFFNLGYLVLSMAILLPYILDHDPKTKTIIESATANGDLFKFYSAMIVGTVLIVGIVIVILLLFYWLIYGILLKRLNHNYNELKKLEV